MKLSDTYPKVMEMVLKDLAKKEILNAYNNPNRIKILDILKKSSNPLSIKDIASKMPIKYKSVYEHIGVLEDVGLVKTKKKLNESGRPVIVEYVGIEKVKSKLKI